MRRSLQTVTLGSVGFLAFISLPLSVQADELSQAALLANACAGCHGTDGRSPGAMPTISGKSAEFIENTMKEFRSGARESTVMQRHASGYTDEQIRLIAEYFAAK